MTLEWMGTHTEGGKRYTEIARPKDVDADYYVYHYPRHVSVMGTLGMEEWPQQWVEPGAVAEQAEAAKAFCERDYQLRLRRKRWQDYMDTHEPGEGG